VPFLAELCGSVRHRPWRCTRHSGCGPTSVLHTAAGEITGTPTGPPGTVEFIAEVTVSEATPSTATVAESITVTATSLTVTTVTQRLLLPTLRILRP
jgi:hypothetical protein